MAENTRRVRKRSRKKYSNAEVQEVEKARVQKVEKDIASVKAKIGFIEDEIFFRNKEIEILRWIDTSILSDDSEYGVEKEEKIHEIYSHVCGFISNSMLPNGDCTFYVNLDQKFSQLNDDRETSDFEAELTCNESNLDWIEIEKKPLHKTCNGGIFSSIFPNSDFVYTEPVFIFGDKLLGVFVITEKFSKDNLARLNTADALDTFRGIFMQLKIAYKYIVEHKRTLELNDLWTVFAEKELSPHTCFSILTNRIPKFLPQLGPMRVDENLMVQIFIVRGSVLRIRASTGKERDTETIKIEGPALDLFRSGHLADNLPLVFDPTEQGNEKYKRVFLGTKIQEVRTVALIPFIQKNSVFGVLCIKSVRKRALSSVQIRTLVDVVRLVTPVVVALEARLQQNKEAQTAYGSIMSNYLHEFGSVLSHGLATPLSGLKGDISLMKTQIDRLSPEKKSERDQKILSTVQAASHAAENNFELVNSTVMSFVNDLSNYVQIGPIELSSLVGEAIDMVKDTKRTTSDDLHSSYGYSINFGVDLDKEYIVRASKLLKPYLVCLLHNAILSIGHRQNTENFKRKGTITVKISRVARGSIDKGIYPQDDIPYSRILLSIRDNGIGVNSSQLRELKRFRFGLRYRTDQGEGFGLAATQRYVSTVDGWMDLKSAVGKGFTVNLAFVDEKPHLVD